MDSNDLNFSTPTPKLNWVQRVIRAVQSFAPWGKNGILARRRAQKLEEAASVASQNLDAGELSEEEHLLADNHELTIRPNSQPDQELDQETNHGGEDAETPASDEVTYETISQETEPVMAQLPNDENSEPTLQPAPTPTVEAEDWLADAEPTRDEQFGQQDHVVQPHATTSNHQFNADNIDVVDLDLPESGDETASIDAVTQNNEDRSPGPATSEVNQTAPIEYQKESPIDASEDADLEVDSLSEVDKAAQSIATQGFADKSDVVELDTEDLVPVDVDELEVANKDDIEDEFEIMRSKGDQVEVVAEEGVDADSADGVEAHAEDDPEEEFEADSGEDGHVEFVDEDDLGIDSADVAGIEDQEDVESPADGDDIDDVPEDESKAANKHNDDGTAEEQSTSDNPARAQFGTQADIERIPSDELDDAISPAEENPNLDNAAVDNRAASASAADEASDDSTDDFQFGDEEQFPQPEQDEALGVDLGVVGYVGDDEPEEETPWVDLGVVDLAEADYIGYDESADEEADTSDDGEDSTGSESSTNSEQSAHDDQSSQDGDDTLEVTQLSKQDFEQPVQAEQPLQAEEHPKVDEDIPDESGDAQAQTDTGPGLFTAGALHRFSSSPESRLGKSQSAPSDSANVAAPKLADDAAELDSDNSDLTDNRNQFDNNDGVDGVDVVENSETGNGETENGDDITPIVGKITESDAGQDKPQQLPTMENLRSMEIELDEIDARLEALDAEPLYAEEDDKQLSAPVA